MLSVFLGIMTATLLMSAAPVYLDALERQSINSAVESAVARDGEGYFTITVRSSFIPLEAREIDGTDAAMSDAVSANVGPIHTGTDRYLKTSFYSAILPRKPPTPTPTPDPDSGEEPEPPPGPVVQGLAQSFTRLERHVTIIEGESASDAVLRGPQGPMLEALASARTAAEFGNLKPGDTLAIAPSLDSPVKLYVRIAGLIEATDPEDTYWQSDADAFLFPRIPNEEGEITEQSDPALGVFVSQAALTNVVGSAFPGAAVDSTWYNAVDSSVLRTWSKDEMRERMEGLREALSVSMPGVSVFSGIDIMLVRFGRSSFLSSVPLLLMLTALSVAVLYFLFMIVSYLVPRRESDVALFRSRGTGTWRLLRLYLVEGAILTITAAAIAPFLALGVVWLAGLLPYFEHITDGRPLPVYPSWAPFIAAAVAGLLCLVIFVGPGVLGARSGLIIHRLRASRPPSIPLAQRFYIDIGFLLVGGILFWELQARGELVTGSLFGERDVNEALLVAPALFLIAVGMMFFRLFPMFIRYVSGESLALVHLATAITLPVLAGALALDSIRAGAPTGWIPNAAPLAAFAAAYWLTARMSRWPGRAFWTLAQAAALGWFIYNAPPDPDSMAAIFVGSVALICLLPAQIAFYILAESMRRAPVWVSMSMWHMARNPLQYSWLVLLLVLAGGIGILATTVGATLDRSYEERVRYNVGSDIRVFRLDPYLARGGDGTVAGLFGEMPGVESVSVAHRGTGRIGAGQIGSGFSYLAVDTETFDAWHRGDFFAGSLEDAIAPLNVEDQVKPIEMPAGTRQIRIRVHPESFYPLVFLWVALEDANGRSDTVTMGELIQPGWTVKSADVPDHLVHPVSIVSVQINEPGFGATATAGATLLDDLEAVDAFGNATLLEGFEGELEWVPLVTSALGSDEVSIIYDNPHSGSGAARLAFGKETNRGIRGIYRASGNGYIPAVVSSSFAANVGGGVNTGLLINLPGGIVPVVISGIVEYFPTMDPARGGFAIFDIDTLSRYLDTLNPTGETAINEAFIHTAPGADAEAFGSVAHKIRARGDAIGVEERLAAQAIDPLISAGWRTIALVALGVIMFIAGLGYVVYLLAFAESNIGEMGALRSLGFSRFQTIALIGLEHMLIALIGLGVGTWAGFQMSRMMAASVTVTDSGGRVLPPFILTTNWPLMGALYIALIVIFITALLTFGGRMLSLDLRRLSRMET